ncbi:glutathione S-transferase [Cellvibrio zantedeschiae]|uniref:Glutathione S-transferase n=1 Tax=Cellvibrio zantedeschiae TaxID=1237077 RepID=A0ABQ3AP02_9GAMM|nr:glutathione transferase GstA [Cellvibrio zantedeschiae]GGY62051.1 glutathione S-transferase [Cellvibrio zantedeschiae]
MKLYFSPGACSLAPHIVLREAGLNFDLEQVNLNSHRTQGGADFYAINPKGQVPTLELEDGSRLTEGPIIAQFIADMSAEDSLLPESKMTRYRVTEWQNYITSELHKSFTPLFNAKLDASAKATLRSVLRKKYEWLETQLAQRDYLTGNEFTIADAYLFTVTGWAAHVDLSLADLPNLQAYLTRIKNRPAVKAAMQAEGLLS